MLLKLNKRIWVEIVIAVALLALGVFIYFAYTDPTRILSKYSRMPGFDHSYPAMADNLRIIKQHPGAHGAYHSLAQGFYSLKGYDDALWAISEAVKLSPNTYYYWLFLGQVQQTRKNYPAARDAYIKALDLEPNKPVNYTTLAWLYYFRLEPEKNKAYDALKQGLEKFPDDKNILFDITRYYMYDENKDEFLKYAPRYRKLDPNNSPINEFYNKWKRK